MPFALGVDVGGTKVAAGVVDDDGVIVAEVRRPTPSHDPAAIVAAIVEAVEETRSRYDVVAVGLGAAGFVDADRSTVRFAPNLAWREEPLGRRVAERVGLPVVVENDANAAAWAEYRFGAGRGAHDLVVITVGTGIGGGFLLGGALYRGSSGIAGEPGHVMVVPNGERCGCGNRGCWEQYASGSALTREARERAVASPAAAGRLLDLAGGDPALIEGPHVTAAARAGDPLATEVLAEAGRWLGIGLANLAALLDPAAFVVGGGVAEAGDLLLGPARSAYAGQLTGRGHRVIAPVHPAALGNDAGVIGAADLARLAVPA